MEIYCRLTAPSFENIILLIMEIEFFTSSQIMVVLLIRAAYWLFNSLIFTFKSHSYGPFDSLILFYVKEGKFPIGAENFDYYRKEMSHVLFTHQNWKQSRIFENYNPIVTKSHFSASIGSHQVKFTPSKSNILSKKVYKVEIIIKYYT